MDMVGLKCQHSAIIVSGGVLVTSNHIFWYLLYELLPNGMCLVIVMLHWKFSKRIRRGQQLIANIYYSREAIY